MQHSKIVRLRKKNDDLRQLVIRLGTILVRNTVEQRELLGIHSGTLPARVLSAITPVGVVDRLRDISLRCSELSRDCCDDDDGRALEGLGVELATEAEALEALLRTPGGQN